jgi:glycosyltransferase involved in cell wall biosynthesis
MKVLHVIPGVAVRYGGPSQAVMAMCRALLERRVDVLMVSTDADGPGRLPVTKGRPCEYQGVPSIFFPRQWSEAFKYSYPLERWLKANVRNFDVVHIHAVFSHSSVAAARACRRRGVPYVVRPLGSLSAWSMGQKPLRKRVMWRMGVRQMLDGARRIHYTTLGEEESSVYQAGPSRGVIVPLGVEVSEEAGQLTPSSQRQQNLLASGANPYVLVLCRLHPVKNLELFLQTFLKVTVEGKFRHWKLLVAGDGERNYVARLKGMIPEGDERVRFTGWLDEKDKTAAIRGASLMALPSRHENFGLSVVEALMHKVPVFISRQVNLAAEIEAARAGWVVEPGRLAMEGSLAAALEDTDGRRVRGHSGYELVHARFTWPRVAAQLVKMYDSISEQAE